MQTATRTLQRALVVVVVVVVVVVAVVVVVGVWYIAHYILRCFSFHRKMPLEGRLQIYHWGSWANIAMEAHANIPRERAC